MTASFKADLIYGATGTTKTSQIGRVAEYVMQKYGKRTLLVTADGGGYAPVQPLVDAGIVNPWPIRNRIYPIEAMDMACQGYWPIDVADPASKLVKMTDKDFKDYGFLAIEGLTSFGDLILEHLRRNSQTMKLQQDVSFTVQDGMTKYSGGNIAQFGFVQDRLYEFVMKSHMLPFEKVLWTALEAKGEEEGTRSPIFGPAIAGKKATGKAGQWFGNMIHMEATLKDSGEDKETQQRKLTTEVYMYLRPHAELVSKITFPAKTRTPYQYAGEMPERMKPDMKELYEKLDELQQRAVKEIQQKYKTASPEKVTA